MDKEYLEDYEQTEKEEYKRLVVKRIQEGKFDFENDRYPPNKRFVKLKKPVACSSLEAGNIGNIWAQVPFCGSLVILLPPWKASLVEKHMFKISEIPSIIDFIKDTGKLQVALSTNPREYEGLDHLVQFFEELRPPTYVGVPFHVLGHKQEIQEAKDAFYIRGGGRFIDFCEAHIDSLVPIERLEQRILTTYIALELGRYEVIKDIENSMINNPPNALLLLYVCKMFLVDPFFDLRSKLCHSSLQEIKRAQVLPLVYQPKGVQFPCEIGRFLMKKLTYSAQDMRACYELMDHYESYDLQEVQKSLNEAIVTNHPDIVSKSTEALSEILDNAWNDKTIPKRIENIKIGLPISIAAVGAVAGGLLGGPHRVGTGGFLAELGYKVAEKAVDKLFAVKGEKPSEKLAKLRTKSYQANVYDFKKKYKAQIRK